MRIDMRWWGHDVTAMGWRMHGLPLLVTAVSLSACAPAPALQEAAPPAPSRTAPSPRDVLGLEVGADSVLADWSQIGTYMSALATASECVRLDTVGRTTLDRPLLLVTFTAPKNQARLSTIKQHQALLADPRRLTPELEDSLIRSTPAVVFINNNIHSTEIGSSQFSMLLAHQLATDDRYQELLHDVVVLMTPSANPDGLDMVVNWYRRYKGSAFEGGPLPWLYHHYVGHDNNRDWYMLTQVESQALARVLYQEWFPEIVWDVHQMGNRGARMFLPPFSDPVNPNLDPILVEATNLVGTAMAAALYDAGKTGVQHQARFDLWWHGGFRTVPARHNMIGILSEAASAQLASPIFQDPDSFRAEDRGISYPDPWRGGNWGIGDIIEYELIAANGLITLAAVNREQFVRRFVTLGKRAVAAGKAGNPYAYLIPPEQHDPWAATVLANALLASGVEVLRAGDDFMADGNHYGKGTLIIPMAQPFRSHVKDLLEVQTYPDIRQYPGGPPQTPYDVAGWTLPMQMGVSTPRIDAAFVVDAEPVGTVTVPPGSVHGSGTQWVLANRVTMESRTIAEALKDGARLWLTREPVTLAGTTLPVGSVVLEDPAQPSRLTERIEHDTRAYGFDAWGTSGLQPTPSVLDRLPRIGLYKPWTASMDEGWTRWVLEDHGIPYVTVTDSMIRAGDLRRALDVLLLPDLDEASIIAGRPASATPQQYAGGMTEAGAQHVAAFVRAGGTLVTIDGSSEFAISLLGLPARNVLRAGRSRGVPSSDLFYAPGSVFEVELDRGSSLASGARDTTYVYYSRGAAFDADGPARVVARYVSEPLRSGFALNQEALGGRAALVAVHVDRGRAILFGFLPQFRGQPYGTFKLLFNALLLGSFE